MYAHEITEASKSALLELALALKRHHDDMVLIGGWAPYFLSNPYFPHCGSEDIDFVLKSKIMPKYESIRKTVTGLGYEAEAGNPFRFTRTLRSPVDDKDYSIHLDFLCDTEGARYATHLVQPDLEAFVFDGLDLAFDFNFEQDISTTLPGNGKARASVRVADLVAITALKGKAMDGRFKPKDPYDIFALAHYGGGPKQAAAYFNQTLASKKLSPKNKAFLTHSLSVIREKFADFEQVGPSQVETFTEPKYTRPVVAAQVNQFLEGLST